jgi:hypothetical protein
VVQVIMSLNDYIQSLLGEEEWLLVETEPAWICSFLEGGETE